jgi:hypothetical protein
MREFLRWVSIVASVLTLTVVLIQVVGGRSPRRSTRWSWDVRSKGFHLETGYLFDQTDRFGSGLEVSGKFYRLGPVTVKRSWDAQSHIEVTNPVAPPKTTRIF